MVGVKDGPVVRVAVGVKAVIDDGDGKKVAASVSVGAAVLKMLCVAVSSEPQPPETTITINNGTRIHPRNLHNSALRDILFTPTTPPQFRMKEYKRIYFKISLSAIS